MREVRLAAGAIAVFAAALAVFLGMALGYQWLHARYVHPLKVVPVKIELPDLLTTRV